MVNNLITNLVNTPAVMIIRKNSPKILLAAGIVGGVAATVMACKGTLKAQKVIEEHKNDVKAINEALNSPYKESYDKQDAIQDMATTYFKTAKSLIKIYSPSLGLGAFAIASILGSYGIMNKRVIGITAAYSFINGKFKEYRKNVVEDLGEEKDLQYYHNLKTETVKVTEKVDGKNKKVSKDILVAGEMSQYARFFDDASDCWQDNPELNLLFLRCQQNTANDILKSRGHIFLNEVYDMLGIPRTSAGAIVGWVFDEADPHADNYVDFGIYSIDNQEHRDFVNGYNPAIFLDFNVDGVIYDLIG